LNVDEDIGGKLEKIERDVFGRFTTIGNSS
jgi:hypothetical protein